MQVRDLTKNHDNPAKIDSFVAQTPSRCVNFEWWHRAGRRSESGRIDARTMPTMLRRSGEGVKSGRHFVSVRIWRRIPLALSGRPRLSRIRNLRPERSMVLRLVDDVCW